MSLVAWIDRKFYPSFERNWDDKLFREAILLHVDEDSRVLDLGAGAGIVEPMNFRGQVARICGVDLDPRVTENPFLDEGLISDATAIPYPNESFDLVFSDNVFEHLEDPDAVLAEVHRLLVDGGVLLFKTPNRRHYMPLIARLTPHWFHERINRMRGRASEDTFPTHYRANTPEDIRALAKQNGFEVVDIALVEGRPEYLRISGVSYIIGLMYERLVNSVGFLRRYRILLVATLRRLPANHAG